MSLFARHLKTGGDYELFLLEGIDITGRNRWYLMKVGLRRLPAFRRMIAQPAPARPEEYGEVLFNGYGHPTSEEMEMMLKEVG